MKTAFLNIGALALCMAQLGQEQVPPAPTPAPINFPFCILASDLASSVGQTVTVRARVIPMLGVLSMFDPNCDKFIVVTYPIDPSALAALRRSKQFRQFQHDLQAKVTPRNAKDKCIKCNRYEVTATISGLLKYVKQAAPARNHTDQKEPTQPTRNIRLVVRSVSDVATKDLYGTFYDRRKYLP